MAIATIHYRQANPQFSQKPSAFMTSGAWVGPTIGLVASAGKSLICAEIEFEVVGDGMRGCSKVLKAVPGQFNHLPYVAEISGGMIGPAIAPSMANVFLR